MNKVWGLWGLGEMGDKIVEEGLLWLLRLKAKHSAISGESPQAKQSSGN